MDNFAYEGCPMENCNKKLIPKGDDTFSCGKCGKTTSTFVYKYMLRASIADATDNQWVTAFDEVARVIFGVTADDLMKKKDKDMKAFDSVVYKTKFQRFNFRLLCKSEIFSGENRLKVTVISAKKVDSGGQDHLQKVKMEIEKMNL